jgi:hypothetical protein
VKKTILFLFCGILFSQLSFSQYVRFGLDGGINLCGLYGPDKPHSFVKDYGYKGGLYIDSRIGEFTSSLFEINFTQYHFHFSEPLYMYENSLLSVKEKNTYISIPAMIRYKRGYEFIFYYLNAGVQISALIGQKRETILYLNNLPVDDDYYYGYKNNPFDFGLVGGVGFQFKPITVELRYYLSTNNIYKRDDTREMRYNILSLEASFQLNYIDKYPFGRKTGWKGFKYKLTHLFK